MIRTITSFLQILAAPLAVPLLRSARVRKRSEVAAAGARHGLVPTEDPAVNQEDRRLVGRVDGHAVIVGSEVFPRITVLQHWNRRLEFCLKATGGEERVTKRPFDSKHREFNRLFPTRFIDPGMVARAGEDKVEALTGEIAGFAARFRGELADLVFEPDYVEARLRYYPFVPATDAKALDEMLPQLVALARRVEETFGPDSDRVDEGEYLGTVERRQVGDVPASVGKATHEFG
ncbi:hypothetical protein ABI59_02655 [Acidobacteria bacterium Mor1]|nr:hypothetical protein ABI59_02655 [Acidobacteria bacterium Mor1]